jgi:hypothetical protein
LADPGLGAFYKQSIFEPGQPQSENACGFLRRLFEMIFEITAVLFLVQGVSVLSRLIGRRREVLYQFQSRPGITGLGRRAVGLGFPTPATAEHESYIEALAPLWPNFCTSPR